MNVQQLTEEEKSTDEYVRQMEQSNNVLNKQLGAKYVHINIASVPDWIRLSIDVINPEFEDEFHKVISYYDVPHADEEQPKEETTHNSKWLTHILTWKLNSPGD